MVSTCGLSMSRVTSMLAPTETCRSRMDCASAGIARRTTAVSLTIFFITSPNFRVLNVSYVSYREFAFAQYHLQQLLTLNQIIYLSSHHFNFNLPLYTY